MERMNPIRRAVEVLGSQSLLAAALGVKQPTISEWARWTVPIPIERCVDIERVTGGIVTRRHLRPDDWHRIWPELVTPEHPIPADAKEAA
jgi:DNA-binding transcriptional regulator YdaS (Cro superfamily)